MGNMSGDIGWVSIVDNLVTHGTAAVEAFLETHHRVFLHRTPTHASWPSADMEVSSASASW